VSTVIDLKYYPAILEIGETVVSRVGIPKDRWEIAAQLEVLGYRDVDARHAFGLRDLFETADAIFDLFLDGELAFRVEGEDAVRRVNPILTFFRHYLDGLMFSLPMLLQAVTMLVWGYGLWGAVDLDARTGSAIGLGFITSYIVTSGFSWAIVSRGLYYKYQNEGALARWSALRMWSVSVRFGLAAAIPAILFSILYRLLPLEMSFTALAYYVALVFFWLNWSLIYLVGRSHWLLVTIAISIFVVIGAARYLGWPVVGANLTGLAVADVLTLLIGLDGLRRWARNGNGKATTNPPRLTVLIYATAQVFLYGFLYSAFIFTDRILAWTGSRGREDFPPYPFWLSPRYELGMDVALIVVILLAGVVEYSAQRFSTRLVPSEKRVKSGSTQPFLDEFRAFNNKHSILLVVAGLAAIVVAALAFRALEQNAGPRLHATLVSATTIRVFWVAAISYAIFMFALKNILMLIILSRADVAARCMAIALAANVVVGFIVSRSIDFAGSVVGLFVGSLVLAVITHQQIRSVLRELDYNYYAAF